jgi:membrane-bound lytic murein transglycosylase B
MRLRKLALYASLSVSFLLPVSSVSASYADHEKAVAFIDDMVNEHNFDKAELLKLFAQAEKKESILKAIARPAEKRLEWKGYRKIFLTDDRVKKGLSFIKKNRDSLERAEKEYGVPVHVIAAIIGVETRYGRNKGSYRVVDALSTLAFDYPPRSKFFTKELGQVLLLSKEQGFNPLDLKGSYAGAMGYGQFIPSSYRHYAVDFDGDHVADILNNETDAVGSVANYFKMHKWVEGQPVAYQLNKEDLGEHYESLIHKKLKPSHTLAEFEKQGVKIPQGLDKSMPVKLQLLQGASGEEYWLTLKNFYVITRYNHSHLYAMAVYQLSEELREGLE